MYILTTPFLYILATSVCACAIIPIVLLLRFILRKAPKWISVLLWGIVAFSFVFALPFANPTRFLPEESAAPSIQTELPDEQEYTRAPKLTTTPTAPETDRIAIDDVRNEPSDAPATQIPDITVTPEKAARKWDSLSWIKDAIAAHLVASSICWFVGVMCLLSYIGLSDWRLRRKIATAVRLIGNIYQSENVTFPFVFGLVKPRIYLPFKVTLPELEHVIAHEQAHIQRKDHWWKALGFLLLTFHWFNPLMWLAYSLLCRDIELACDERVIRELGSEQRADYTQALVTCSVTQHAKSAYPLAFGAVGVKDRVKAVMNYQRPSFWIKLASLITCITVVICSMTTMAMANSLYSLIKPAKDLPAAKNSETIAPSSDNLLFDPATGTVTGFHGEITELSIPSEIDGVRVVSIGAGAFMECTTLTNVIIPDSVTTIHDDAFYSCYSLTTVTIPASVTTMGNYLFNNCENLTDIYYSGSRAQWDAYDAALFTYEANIHYYESEYAIPGGSLYYDPATGTVTGYAGEITELNVPAKIDGVPIVAIGEMAFSFCSSLTDITLPDSIATIGDGAFFYCDSLTGITLPDSVTTIEEQAFYGCNSLTSVTIPNSVTIIDAEAFSDCASLTDITIPNSVTTIGDYAFSGCRLSSITLSDSIASIGPGAFAGCSLLEGFVVDENNPNYCNDENGVLFSKDKTELVMYPGAMRGEYTIPDSVTTIGEGAFYACNNLTAITIPDSVETIYAHAFADCEGLTSVTIPDSVTTIEMYAFFGCRELVSVEIPDSLTALGDFAFESCVNLTDVYYRGTFDQWYATIGSALDRHLTVHFNSVMPSLR